MKKCAFIFLAAVLCITTSCVQKAYEKTVMFIVDVSKIKDIQSVGLRGEEKPLGWRKDLAMMPIKKDSLYIATVTFLTGYKFTEVKFVVNGKFELEGKDNRRVLYGDKDTTIYQGVFNVER